MASPVFKAGGRTVRSVMREHLKHGKKNIYKDLATMLGLSESSTRKMMWRNLPIQPRHVETFIKAMRLDEFDANELRLFAARELGLNIDPRFLYLPE